MHQIIPNSRMTFRKNGYDAVLAYEAGLLSRNDETFDYFDRFRDRIIFPLLNFQGKTVGFLVEHIRTNRLNI